MDKNSVKSNRVGWLDFARVFAIISVVFCHAIQSAYVVNVKEWDKLVTGEKIFRTIGFTFGRLGVPIFLYLSGYLLLDREYESDHEVIHFYKRNFLPLLITVQIWNVIYNVFLAIFHEQPIQISVLLKNIFFFEKVDMIHMWYMPMILGVYIAIPFVATILKRFTLRSLCVPMILVFLISSVLPTVNKILDMGGHAQYEVLLDCNFYGGIYGLYIVLGYLVKKKFFARIHWGYIVAIGVVLGMGALLIQLWCFHCDFKYKIWYDSPFILGGTLCLFELMRRIGERVSMNQVWIHRVARCSFGIYLVHSPIQMLLERYTHIEEMGRPMEVIMLFVLAFVLSLIVVMLGAKRKRIGRVLFDMKG